MGELFSWWVVVEIVGIVALPLTATALANLPDSGWAFSKPLGLLALGWLIWLPLVTLTALPYSRLWIVATFIAFAIGNAALLRRQALRETLRTMLTYQRRHVLVAEALFAGAFALFGWFRSFSPAVVDTEKFMDVAFLASLWRTPHLPAPDPWLSGAPINYYYFGHFLLATIAKLLGTVPGTAFNMGLALIFALASLAIFGVATNLTALLTGAESSTGESPPSITQATRGAALTDAARLRATAVRQALPYGLASVVLVLVLGNLNGAQVWWQNATTLARQQPGVLSSPWAWWAHRDLWMSYDWWSPSRVIPGTINEFPAFSFVLADLHAHILALPFAMLALGFGLNLVGARGVGLAAFGSGVQRIVALAATSLSVGSLYAINGWDLPTYLGLALLALAVQQWIAHRRRINTLLALDLFAAAAIVCALAILAFLPFYRGFVSPSEGVALVPLVERTPIGYEFAIFGLPLFIVGSLVAIWLAQSIPSLLQRVLPTSDDSHSAAPSVSKIAISMVAAVVILLLLATVATARNPNWTLFWCVALVLLCGALAIHRLVPPAMFENTVTREANTLPIVDDQPVSARAEVYMLVLIGTAAALVLTCEIIFVRDIFGSRMNTVFKLYFQAWALLGVAAGPALALLLRMAQHQLAGLRARATNAVRDYRLLRPGLQGRPLAFAGAQRRWDGAAADAQPAHAASDNLDAPQSASLSRTRLAAVAGQPPIAPLCASGRDNEAHVPANHPTQGELLPTALRWWRVGGILLWTATLLALTGAALIYPLLATSARTANFATPRTRTLDGTAYMANDPLGQAGCTSPGAGTDHGDQVAIAWLNSHITGSPVILEAPGCEWSHYSRISAFTGLPTLLGWPGGHEGEWRTNWLLQQTQSGATTDLFGERVAAINQIYSSNDQASVTQLLQRYHVRLVYVGAAERALYPRIDMSRFASVLAPIYSQDGTTIYAVRAAELH